MLGARSGHRRDASDTLRRPRGALGSCQLARQGCNAGFDLDLLVRGLPLLINEIIQSCLQLPVQQAKASESN